MLPRCIEKKKNSCYNVNWRDYGMIFFDGDEVPFQYFKYDVKKDIPMSAELKFDFSNYYRHIEELAIDTDGDKLICDLSEQYSVLRAKLIDEIRLGGDKKSTHTAEEMDFIFWCMYLLIDKFALSQNQLAKIFGIKANKFSYFDLFPDRCHSAFVKSDYVSLIPNKTDSIGLKIAKLINTQIQAVYACSELVAITNDTDIFVNVSSTDDKDYVLTSPLNFASDDILSIQRANYAYANYLFSMGNNIYDGDKRVPAGKIKDCIIKLLEMKNLSFAEQDGVLSDVFLSDRDLSAFVTAGDYGSFSKLRAEYQKFMETVNLADEFVKDGIIPYGVEYYDSHFGGSSIDDGADKWAEMWGETLNEKDRKNQSTEEIILSARENALHRIQQFLPQLIGFLDVRKLMSSNEAVLKSWIEVIRKRVKDELIYSVASVDDKKQEGSVLAIPAVEERIKAAASYWISEVFKYIEVSNESIDGVLQWLKTNNLLYYLDRVNQEDKGRSGIHVRMVNENSELEEVLSNTECKKASRPLLLYIDANYFSFEAADVKYLEKRQDCIVVIHDKADTVGEFGFSVLDKELDLYMYDFKKGVK